MSGKKYAFFMMAKNPIFFAQPMSKQFVTASTCKKKPPAHGAPASRPKLPQCAGRAKGTEPPVKKLQGRSRAKGLFKMSASE